MFAALNLEAKHAVPSAVLQAFHSRFPQAQQVHWQRESKTEYEASFTTGTQKCSASFNPGGTWLETETQLAFTDLPAAIQQAFHKRHPEKRIIESSRIEKPDGEMIYEVEFRTGKTRKEELFKADGSIKS